MVPALLAGNSSNYRAQFVSEYELKMASQSSNLYDVNLLASVSVPPHKVT